MDILLAPIYSFFSVSFYRRVIQSSIGKGFLYLLYLSTIYGVILLSLFIIRLKPMADDFVNWFASNLPQLTLTKNGVTASIQQPFTMKSPLYGTILVIDTTKEKADGTAPTHTLIYLTKTQLVFQNEAKSETRILNLLPKEDQAKAKWKDFSVTGAIVQMIYHKILPIVYPFILVLSLSVFFIWKIMASLFYSLIALLLNLFRKEKLGYGSLLVLSMFALTPVAILQIAGFFVPKLMMILSFPVAIVLTTLFLALGILATQAPSEDVL